MRQKSATQDGGVLRVLRSVFAILSTVLVGVFLFALVEVRNRCDISRHVLMIYLGSGCGCCRAGGFCLDFGVSTSPCSSRFTSCISGLYNIRCTCLDRQKYTFSRLRLYLSPSVAAAFFWVLAEHRYRSNSVLLDYNTSGSKAGMLRCIAIHQDE